MTDVEISEERYLDMCFVVNGAHLDDEDLYFCNDKDHAYWLREYQPLVQTKQEYSPRRYYAQFADKNTAILYKLTWGRG